MLEYHCDVHMRGAYVPGELWVIVGMWNDLLRMEAHNNTLSVLLRSNFIRFSDGFSAEILSCYSTIRT